MCKFKIRIVIIDESNRRRIKQPHSWPANKYTMTRLFGKSKPSYIIIKYV